MWTRIKKIFNSLITMVLIVQLAGCGTLLYPERRGHFGGRLDLGIVILDAIGLLFFIIPGAIAFAVDFSDGCIYLPIKPEVLSQADLKKIRFDPKHASAADIERIIKQQTGYSVRLTDADLKVSRLKSGDDMVRHFAQWDNNPRG